MQFWLDAEILFGILNCFTFIVIYDINKKIQEHRIISLLSIKSIITRLEHWLTLRVIKFKETIEGNHRKRISFTR